MRESSVECDLEEEEEDKFRFRWLFRLEGYFSSLTHISSSSATALGDADHRMGEGVSIARQTRQSNNKEINSVIASEFLIYWVSLQRVGQLRQ